MGLPIRIAATLLFVVSFCAAPALSQIEVETVPTPLEDVQPVDDDIYDDEYDDDGLIVTDMEALDKAHQSYLRKSDLQLERPEREPEAPVVRDPPPNWLRAIAAFLEALGPVFKIIFYLAAGLVILGFLYFLFGEAARMRFGKSGKDKVDKTDDVLIDIRPDEKQARSLLEEADALAREGRFAEAVHLLLFRTIDDIQQRLDGGVPRSLTAREIGGLKNLPERARNAMNPIIRIVEFSFFGGQDVNEDGWKTARAHYEDFAFGEGWT